MTATADNLATIMKRIDAAARRVGRNSKDVKLIAVSKTHPATAILEAYKVGQTAFGESYAQELRDKFKEINELDLTAASGIEWHFVGHLQKNKIKYVLPVARWIHSIDSVELLQEIVKRLETGGIKNEAEINCLIEVNIAGELSKSGVPPDKLFHLVEKFSTYALRHLRTHALSLKGLMCMPPVSDDLETSRPYFQKLKNLQTEINRKKIYTDELRELSMGMTGDFEVAIEEGATMVRIGTAIFGERCYL